METFTFDSRDIRLKQKFKDITGKDIGNFTIDGTTIYVQGAKFDVFSADYALGILNRETYFFTPQMEPEKLVA